jgi:hypothetical protein
MSQPNVITYDPEVVRDVLQILAAVLELSLAGTAPNTTTASPSVGSIGAGQPTDVGPASETGASRADLVARTADAKARLDAAIARVNGMRDDVRDDAAVIYCDGWDAAVVHYGVLGAT